MAPIEKRRQEGCVDKYSTWVDRTLHDFFFRVGAMNAASPWRSIGLSMVILLACCGGFSNWSTESRANKLWTPGGTTAQADQDKYSAMFPTQKGRPRIATVMLTAPGGSRANVLTKPFLTAAMEFNNLVYELESAPCTDEKVPMCETGRTDGLAMYNFSTLCMKTGPSCLQKGVLGVWNYDAATLAADTNPLASINAQRATMDMTVFGNLVVDAASGDVISAEAIKQDYFLEFNYVLFKMREEDAPAEMWEKHFLNLAKGELAGTNKIQMPASVSGALHLNMAAARSFSDEFGGAIKGDVVLMNISFVLMITYLACFMGRSSCPDTRVALAFLGVLSVGMAIGFSFGLSSAMGIFYTPLHSVLPFVLLGIGVDDCFVLVNAFDNTDRKLPLETRIAEALGHAGVSISVTSLTDLVAFAIGSSTALPALSSFCSYAAVAIAGLYFFQCTFFCSCLVLDERRKLRKKLDCCCCCAKLCCCSAVSPACVEAAQDAKTADDAAVAESERKQSWGCMDMLVGVMEKLSDVILRPNMKIAVLVPVVGFLAVSIYGASQLTVENSRVAFIPDGSYMIETFAMTDKYFSQQGVTTNIAIGEIDYFAHRTELAAVRGKFTGVEDTPPYIATPVLGANYVSVFDLYADWLSTPAAAGAGVTPAGLAAGMPKTEADYYNWLDFYLKTSGARYSSYVKFADAAQPALGIVASRIKLTHACMATEAIGSCTFNYKEDTAKEVRGMDAFRKSVTELGLPTAFAHTYAYLNWETFKVIRAELYLNVALSLLAVFIITLALIAHPLTAFLVFVCVLVTIIDILGGMWMWGLVIDSVSVIYLVLAFGLCVDYSAHIGHCFMLKGGTRDERARAALVDIGAPVINGAFSTFLGVVTLAFSSSYVFRALFQQFFTTCLFGVFHGVFLLPVLLSWFGPPAYASVGAGGKTVPVDAAAEEDSSMVAVSAVKIV